MIISAIQSNMERFLLFSLNVHNNRDSTDHIINCIYCQDGCGFKNYKRDDFQKCTSCYQGINCNNKTCPYKCEYEGDRHVGLIDDHSALTIPRKMNIRQVFQKMSIEKLEELDIKKDFILTKDVDFGNNFTTRALQLEIDTELIKKYNKKYEDEIMRDFDDSDMVNLFREEYKAEKMLRNAKRKYCDYIGERETTM